MAGRTQMTPAATLLRGVHPPFQPSVRHRMKDFATINLLRSMVIARPYDTERFHAVFVDEARVHLGDAPMGRCGRSGLSLRMRELFTRALGVGASGILIAHNHPSGKCRPSQCDIESTRRLEEVARALDIELLDHLIFTQDAFYSMRAGALHEFENRKRFISR